MSIWPRQWRAVEPAPPETSDPDWGAAGKVHDWRNHVSCEIRALWATFTHEQKLALTNQAQAAADAEEWD